MMVNQTLKQRRAINLFFIVLLVLGILSLSQLGTAELPEPPGFGISITAVLPGAAPEEMDKKVARLLHNAIKNIPGVENVASSSREAHVSLSVTFTDDHDNDDALEREITQAINQVADLPTELQGPFVSRQSNRIFPAMTLLLEGGNDLQRHNSWHQLQQILNNINAVDFIETIGDRERRIEIQLDTMKLQQLGADIDNVRDIIQQAITNQSAGRQETFLSLTRFRVLAHPHSLSELAKLPIKIANTTLPLERIADIREMLSAESLRVTHGGKKAWYINLYRRNGTTMADLSKAVTNVVQQSNQQFIEQHQDLRLVIIQDRNIIVDRVLGELSNSILLGMLLVLIVLWCFFGFHNALYAAIGIPFSFLVTFIAMDALGIGLNTLTLFGLVMVCGMIVDDAIVVLENIWAKIEHGREIRPAIKAGLAEVLPAVLASTGTTVAAFLPLLLMTGGMGDFISQIPKVAILALLASLLECLIILPVHIYRRAHHQHQQPKNINRKNIFNRNMDKCAKQMSRWVTRLLLKPYRVLTVFFGLLILTGTLAYFTMDFELFDADEVRSIKVHLAFPKRIDLSMTSRLLEHKRRELENLPLVSDVIVLSGWSDYNYKRRNRSHLATVEILLNTAADAPDKAKNISIQVENLLNNLPGLEKLQIVMTKNKPPVSTPVIIYLYGNDAESLAQASNNVHHKLSSIASIENISNPMENGIPELVFNVNEEMASYYGLPAKEIGRLLHMAVTGVKIAKMDRGDEIIDVYVLAKKPPDWRSNPMDHLSLPDGQVIPLTQLGAFTKRLAPDAVKRYQGNRYIAITAGINTSILSNYKTHRQIEQLISEELLPKGVSFEQLGEFSNTQKSLTSMFQSALLALGLSYLILAMLFRSYAQPLIVLLTIPLAYMGVIWGITLMGQNLTLMGLVGIIGLIGIVVNDSLVWINCYNHLKRKSENGDRLYIEDSRLAAAKAVELRFRPIMLTTMTTIMGMLPVSLSGSAGIASAMANTIVSGLFTASLLLMVFLPVCVVIMDELNKRLANMSVQKMFEHIIYTIAGIVRRKLRKAGFTSW